MRFIRTTNNIAEFIETDKTGKIISSRGFQFGVIYFEIKNKKVAFYLDNDEQPFQNFVWSTDIPLTIDDVEYETEEEVSAALHSIFNDRFQEQLDELRSDLDEEIGRSIATDEALGEEIDDERDRAISAETYLQNQVTELSGAVAVLGNRVTNVENDLSALTDTVNDEITRSTAKDAEHDTLISGLTDDLASEIARATARENQLDAKIDLETQNRIADVNAEENRAIAAEQALDSKIDNEITRSTEKDAQHDTQISALTVSLDNEINRATTAENALRSDLNDEIADRISGDTNLQNQLNAEIARAQNAEEDIDDKIDAEIARANSEETRIEGKLDNEITRSTAKDTEHDTLISGLTTNLQNEINRATSAENSLRNDLNAEISRATDAENALDDKIDLEIQNRINAVSGLTERVVDDEAAFGAALVDLNNKINAVSGENASQTIQISGLNASLNTEISRATSVENALRSDLTNETSARTAADTAQIERIVALEVGKADKSDLNNYYTKGESDGKYQLKGDYVTGAQMSAFTYDKQTIDDKIAQGGSFDPTQYYNKTATDALLANKADLSGLTSHTANTTVHVTSAEKNTWNNKSDFSGNYNDLTNKPTIHTYSAGTGIDITSDVISVTGGSQPVDAYTKAESDAKFATITNFNSHSGNTTMHVTSAEKATWNAKPNVWCGNESEWSQISGSTESGTIYLVY